MTREEMILSLEPCVAFYAKALGHKAPSQPDDLYQVAWLGAIKAVDRFNPLRGVKLRSYASHIVHGAILDYLKSRAYDCVPRAQRKKIQAGASAPIVHVDISRLYKLVDLRSTRDFTSIEFSRARGLA